MKRYWLISAPSLPLTTLDSPVGQRAVVEEVRSQQISSAREIPDSHSEILPPHLPLVQTLEEEEQKPPLSVTTTPSHQSRQRIPQRVTRTNTEEPEEYDDYKGKAD